MSKVLRGYIAALGLIAFMGLGVKFMPLYSLWDDEANTALFAQTVRDTGDTSAVLGRNIIAYRKGAELNTDLKARYVSPLQYYFLGAAGRTGLPNPARERLPFFMLSFAALIVMYRRIFLLRMRPELEGLFAVLTVGLTSLFLFSIQCRYYAICILLTVLIGDLYWFRSLRLRSTWVWLGFLCGLCFISNYLVGVAVLGALGVHYLVYRRYREQFSWRNTIIAISLFLAIALPVFLIWNPIGKNVVGVQNTGLDRLNLIFRNVRDFNGGHFGSLLVLLVGSFAFRGEIRKRFRQYALIFFSYVVLISMFSPQPIQGTVVADIRYLVPLIILALVWMIDAGGVILRKTRLGFYLFLLVFGFTSIPYSGELRVPLADLVCEMHYPASDPYALIADALRFNANPGDTVQLTTDYATYPVMYLAPEFKYLGQGMSADDGRPNYWVSLCNDSQVLASKAKYKLIASIHAACEEKFRPEIFHRSFGKNEKFGELRIFKRM